MITVRDAKPALAITSLVLPWDLFVFGQQLGWGLSFSIGRYAVTPFGGQFLSLVELHGLLAQFDATSRIGILLWIVAGGSAVLAAGWVSVRRAVHGGLPPTEDRVVGGLFLVAGGLFVFSRFFLYEYLLVSSPTNPNWFSVPIGALYVIFVGAVFYFDLFRYGASEGPDVSSPPSGT